MTGLAKKWLLSGLARDWRRPCRASGSSRNPGPLGQRLVSGTNGRRHATMGELLNGKPGAIRHWAGAILSAAFVTLAISAPASAQIASDEFVAERTFFRTNIDGKSVRLEGLVLKRADLTGKLPIALITHGKSANLTDMLESKAADYAGSARDLARRGWLSVVVMRRGFGQSDGPMPVEMTCDTASFANRFAADADDLQGAMDIIVKRPDADPDRAIAIGVSAGGAAAMALCCPQPEKSSRCDQRLRWSGHAGLSEGRRAGQLVQGFRRHQPRAHTLGLRQE